MLNVHATLLASRSSQKSKSSDSSCTGHPHHQRSGCALHIPSARSGPPARPLRWAAQHGRSGLGSGLGRARAPDPGKHGAQAAQLPAHLALEVLREDGGIPRAVLVGRGHHDRAPSRYPPPHVHPSRPRSVSPHARGCRAPRPLRCRWGDRRTARYTGAIAAQATRGGVHDAHPPASTTNSGFPVRGAALGAWPRVYAPSPLPTLRPASNTPLTTHGLALIPAVLLAMWMDSIRRARHTGHAIRHAAVAQACA